jgi:group I intron endonuclease
MLSSAYKIMHRDSGREYVGITSRDPQVRWKEHQYDAAAGRTKMHVHRALKKYGTEAFDFEVVAQVPTLEEARIVEMLLVATERPAFNLTAGGQGQRGRVKSAEEREKIGAGRRGQAVSDEVKAKISKAVSVSLVGNQRAKGVKHTAESRANMGAARVGTKRSPETKAKMAAARKAWWDRQKKETTP